MPILFINAPVPAEIRNKPGFQDSPSSFRTLDESSGCVLSQYDTRDVLCTSRHIDVSTENNARILATIE